MQYCNAFECNENPQLTLFQKIPLFFKILRKSCHSSCILESLMYKSTFYDKKKILKNHPQLIHESYTKT